MKVLVISPHPDDEILGCGGTMHRLAGEGHKVVTAIVTKGWAPLFPDSQVEQVRAEAQSANEQLGVGELLFLDLPVTTLARMPEHELNRAIGNLISDVKADWVFLPFGGDRHEDHRQIFAAAMVALRPEPGGYQPQRVYCYETVSETHWTAPGVEPPFDPQVYIDVTDHLPAKLEAMRTYKSQLKPAGDARSLEAIEALATWRGSIVGLNAAEAFVLIRDVIRTTS